MLWRCAREKYRKQSLIVQQFLAHNRGLENGIITVAIQKLSNVMGIVNRI